MFYTCMLFYLPVYIYGVVWYTTYTVRCGAVVPCVGVNGDIPRRENTYSCKQYQK